MNLRPLTLALFVCLLGFGTPLSLVAQEQDPPANEKEQVDEKQPPPLRAALLTYGEFPQSPRCFSTQFLSDARKLAGVAIEPEAASVRLHDEALLEHPFAILAGEGSFNFTEDEREALVRYIERGGFLLASAGCSSRGFAESFNAELAKLFPERQLEKIDPEHPLLHSVYKITESRLTQGPVRMPKLFGLTLGDRLVLVYSPDGLNDTASAGDGCCCCGANELSNARQINTNILTYVLTH